MNPKGLVEILSTADHEVRSLQHVPFRDTWSASFHRDGHRNVAIGTKSGNVLIWDTKTKTIIKTFPTPSQQSAVNFVSFNAKNTMLAATMQNGDTALYGLVSNIPLLTVKLSCSKSISAMKFHHESRALLGLATDEGHVVLRDATTNKDKVMFENVHASPVSDIAYSLVNKDVMLSSGYDKIMHVYDVRLQNVVSTIKTPYTLTSLAINLENQVALGAKNGSIQVYDLRDLTQPFKMLQGHEEEVSKVAFQPVRKKAISTEVSLREDTELLTPHKFESTPNKRTSDVFIVSDSPQKNNLDGSNQMGESKADSFLVMMGLDKSNNELDDEVCNNFEFERRSEKHEKRYRQLDAEKNISKASTPLNSRTAENIIFSTPITTVAMGQCHASSLMMNAKTSSSNLVRTASVDEKLIEELKNFVKLSVTDVAEDNRNYFLHIMMALTKQKLFLEKQLTGMTSQVETLTKNQNALVEMNQKLALEMEQLKSQLSMLSNKE